MTTCPACGRELGECRVLDFTILFPAAVNRFGCATGSPAFRAVRGAGGGVEWRRVATSEEERRVLVARARARC